METKIRQLFINIFVRIYCAKSALCILLIHIVLKCKIYCFRNSVFKTYNCGDVFNNIVFVYVSLIEPRVSKYTMYMNLFVANKADKQRLTGICQVRQ